MNYAKDMFLSRNIYENGADKTYVKEFSKLLNKAQKNLKDHGVDSDTKIAIGPVAAEIIRIAEEGRYNSIWVGSRGYGGIKRMLLGSVADDVIRHAHCSVVVVR